MVRHTTFFGVISVLLLIGVINKVKTDISDEICGEIIEETELSNDTEPKKDYKGRRRPDQRSLIIVFDATGSMATDLNQLRTSAKVIVNKLATYKENPIHNFVLSVFRDPEVEQPLNTKNSSELLAKLDEISVTGGGDCPELALLGIKTTLEHALPNSLLYVFSDASAKDFDLYEHVVSALRKKRIIASFLLTGVCSDGKKAAGYTVYEKLSLETGGQLYDMKREGIKEVLQAITQEMDSKYELLKSVDFAEAGSSRVTLQADESFKKISVTLSGKNSKLAIKNQKNESISTESLVSLDNVKVLQFDITDAPSYFIDASADSSYSIRAGGVSDLKLDFGFSTNVPSEKAETSVNPLRGFPNVISIFISDPKLLKCLTKVKLVPVVKLDESPEIEIPLMRYKRNLFASALFNIPTKMFKIVINGYDNKGNEFERSFATAIEAIEGFPPEIEIEENSFIANQYQNFFLDCKVVSLIPAVSSWMFDEKIIETKASNQSTNLVLEVSEFDVKNVGKYSCKTRNNLGEAVKTVEINIKMSPIVEIEPKIIEVSDHEIVSLNCKVSNIEGEYKVFWIDNEIKHKNESIYQFEARRHHHNTTIACFAQNKDFTVSDSSLIHVLYAPDFIYGASNSQVEIEVLHGSNHELNCESKENGEGKVHWTFVPKTPETEEIINIDVNSKVMELKNMNSSREGLYTCTVLNAVGSATRSFKVIDVSNRPPTIVSSEDIYATNGENVTLECSCKKCLPLRSAWIYPKNERKYDVKKFVDEEKDFFKTTIIIDNINDEDVGIFKCILSNSDKQGKKRESQKEIKVVTHVEPNNVTIIGRKRDQDSLVKEILVLSEPDDLTLECIANAYPIPTIQWMKNGKEIGSGSEVTLSDNVKQNNNGNYSCIASNIRGRISLSVQVKVEISPFTSIKKQQIMLAEDEEQIELKCDIKGSPAPSISWMFNAKPLALTRQTKLSTDRKVVMLKSGAQTVGEYICTGSNAFGEESLIFSVFIKGRPRIINPKNEVFKFDDKDKFYLTCNTIGYPLPKIEWLRNGKVIQTNGHLRVKNSGNHVCKASNVYGVAKKTFNVVESPTIIPIKNVEINPLEISFKIVSCVSHGFPEPDIWWTFNDKEIYEGHDLNVTSLMPSGVYTCVAENTEGKAEQEFNVEILKKPELREDFDETENSQSVPEGDTLELICPFKNYESFIWRKDEKILREHSNKTLKISNIDPESKGIYQCIAFNAAGDSYFEYQVDILTQPMIEVFDHETKQTLMKKSDSENILLEVNEQLNLLCKSQGNPRPNVVWKTSTDLIIGEGESYEIKHISVEDSGNYICSAENSQGIASRKFFVDVYQPPFIEKGSKQERELEFVDEAIVLDCNIFGFPKPTISWLKDDMKIGDEKERTLVVNNLPKNESGIYKCLGENEYGTESIEFFITLKEPAKVLKTEANLKDERYTKIFCDFKGRPLPNISVMNDENVLFESSRLNLPELLDRSHKSTIFLNEFGTEELIYDNKILGNSKHQFFSQLTIKDEGRIQLNMTIRKEFYNSFGSLKCIAKNDKGFDEKIITKPFIFLNDTNGLNVTYAVEYGKPFDIECNFVGDPKLSIVWRLNNTLIKKLPAEFEHINEGRKLRIFKVDKKHGQSIFKCKGENSSGKLIRKIYLNVDMQPRWTEFSEWGSCSVLCGEGIQRRKRDCILLDRSKASSINECKGVDYETRTCKSSCDGWGSWSLYSACSRTCDQGYKFKTRKCLKPFSPEGKNWCEGQKIVFQYCNLINC